MNATRVRSGRNCGWGSEGKKVLHRSWGRKARMRESLQALLLVAQAVKHQPAMQETWVRALSQEDPLEKGMATHSSSLAWRIPWTEEPGGLQPMASQRVRHD